MRTQLSLDNVEQVVLDAIGFWYDPNSKKPPVDPTKLVDPEWAKEDRQRVVEYLKRGDGASRGSMGFSYCRFQCGIPNEAMGSGTFTDGTWSWPEGLAHYVEVHAVRLPDAFLQHVRANAYRIPTASIRRLQRPNIWIKDSFAKWEAWASSRNALVDGAA